MKKRITIEKARELVKDKLDIDSLGSMGLRKIKDIIPFSWHMYCKDNNLNTNLLMDGHEKRCRMDERKTQTMNLKTTTMSIARRKMNDKELLKELGEYLKRKGWNCVLISEEGILDGEDGKKNSFRLSFKFIAEPNNE